MTCKDCLHYEACDRLTDAKLGYGIMQVQTDVCNCFSDKSEWFHLLSKDHETAYYVVGYGDNARVIEEPICGWGVKDGKPSVIDAYGDLYEINTEVYLTKEAAEKDVKRRRRTVNKSS